MEGRLQVFSGNANLALATDIAACLNLNLGRALVSTFKNGETRIKIEENVRGSDVFIVQPTCNPVNDNLMQLLIMIDAVKRASAARITAVIPYYGYARQEKKTTGREPISAKLVANLIRTAGAHRVLTMDLHAPAIEGFFDIPVDHLQAGQLLSDYVRSLNLKDPVVISPDAGGVGQKNHRARAQLGHHLATATTGTDRPGRVGDDCQGDDMPCAMGIGVVQGDTFGAHGTGVGGVFDVAAGDDVAGRGQNGRTDMEPRIRGICLVAGCPGGSNQGVTID